MKKLFLTTIFVCVGIVGIYAQEEEDDMSLKVNLRTEKSHYLPEKGDISLSISADPLWNILKRGESTSSDPEFGNAKTGFETGFGKVGIVFRYFLEDDRSMRIKVNFDFGSKVYKQSVRDDYAFSQPGYNGQTVVDVMKKNGNAFDLAIGYAYHRGYERVFGYFGGEIGGYFDNSKSVYTWANPITKANHQPSIVPENNETSAFNVKYDNHGSRPIEEQSGNAFGLFVGGFIGVEYFVVPKVSIGGEVGMSIGGFNRWQGKTITERWEPMDDDVAEYSYRSFNGKDQSGGFYFKAIPAGKLMISFFF